MFCSDFFQWLHYIRHENGIPMLVERLPSYSRGFIIIIAEYERAFMIRFECDLLTMISAMISTIISIFPTCRRDNLIVLPAYGPPITSLLCQTDERPEILSTPTSGGHMNY